MDRARRFRRAPVRPSNALADVPVGGAIDAVPPEEPPAPPAADTPSVPPSSSGPFDDSDWVAEPLRSTPESEPMVAAPEVDVAEPVAAAEPTEVTGAPIFVAGPDVDLLPTRSAGNRAGRRRRQRQRRVLTIAGAVAGVVLLVALAAWWGSGDDSGGSDAAAARAQARALAVVKSRRVKSTSTTTTTASSSTSTVSESSPTTAPPAAAPPPETGGSGGDTLGDGVTGLSVFENPGACQWDATAEELLESGTIRNDGTEEQQAEVEVVWSDASGELDSWSDLIQIGPGATEAWGMSSGWSDPPQGLSCTVAIIP